MSFKDFDNMLNVGRPDFTVGGQTFQARAKLPWRKFSNLILSMGDGDASSQEGIEKTEDFFKLVLVPSDRDRFLNLLNYDGDEEDTVISPQQVSELLTWLLEYYTGKPLTSDDLSSELPLDTGQPVNGRSEVHNLSLAPKV